MSEVTDYSKMIDLHVHSNASDGTFPPCSIASMAGEMKLGAIALTDHDTVSGVREFLEEGKKYPETEFIAGVELSSMYGSRELHFVGLYVDIDNEEFVAYLEQMRQWRLARNIEIAKRLASLGYPIDRDELDFVHNDSLGRLHFAAYMVKHYNFESIQSVFEKYLRKNCSAYVPRQLPMPSEAIEVIHKAGGIAIWAHPLYRDQKNSSGFLRRMVRKLKDYGLDGLECYYSMFGVAETEMLKNVISQHELLGSGGSDFHGDNRPGIDIASGGGKMVVPYALLEKIHEFRKNSGDLKNA